MTIELKKIQALKMPAKITCLAWSPNGNRMVLACDDGGLHVVDIKAASVTELKVEKSTPSALAWSSDGRLASGFKNGEIKIWDPIGGQNDLFAQPQPEPVQSLVWSPNGDTLVSGSGLADRPVSFRILAWDVRNRKSRELEPRHGQVISSLVFSPDGRHLASGSYDHTISVWETGGNWNRVKTHYSTGGFVCGLAWSFDSRFIIFAANRQLVEWEVAGNGKTRVVYEAANRISAISCSGAILKTSEPDAGFLMAARSVGGETRIWAGLNSREFGVIPDKAIRNEGVTAGFHPKEPILAVLSDGDNAIDLWAVSVPQLKDSAPGIPSKAPASDKAPAPAVSATAQASDFDVAIVCALDSPELEKVRATNATWTKHEIDGDRTHVFYKAELKSSADRTIKVIASAATQMGMAASAVLATKMILKFRPTFIIMVGIAAGTKTDDSTRNYGDILIASDSFDYGSGKTTFRDGKTEFHPNHQPISIRKELLTTLRDLAANRAHLDAIRNRWPGRKPPSALGLHIGPVGSGAAVVDSRLAIEEIERHWRKLIGVEMEIYGVYLAATETYPPPYFLAIKSLCDFAEDKNDSWREYAAYTAAEYCYQFITNEAARFLP